MKILLYSLVLIIFGFQVQSFAQENGFVPKITPKFKLGITGGYNYIFNAGNIPDNIKTIACDSCNCPSFATGQGNGYNIGISLEFDNNKNHKYVANISYINILSYSSRFIFIEDAFFESFPEIKTMKTRHTLDISYSLLNLDVLYKYLLFDEKLGISIGPSFGLNVKNNITTKHSIIEPKEINYTLTDKNRELGYRLEDNDRTVVIIDGNIPNVNNFRIGFNFGIEYRINLWGFEFIPNVNYNQSLTKVTNNDNWLFNYLQAGLSVLYPI